MNFLTHYDMNFIDKYFDRKNVCSTISEGDEDEHFMNPQGYFPGPINNYQIIDFVDYWHDPEPSEAYTNTYMRKDIQENVDFLYLNPDIYNYLQTNVKTNFDIERKTIKRNGNELIEVHLLKVKSTI